MLLLKTLNKDPFPSRRSESRGVIFFHTDPNWVPSIANDSDSHIHLPPVWDKDRRKWYIPPPGWLPDPGDLPNHKQYVLPVNWRPDPHDTRAVAATGSSLFSTGSGLLPTGSGPLTIGSGLLYTSSAPLSLSAVSKSGPPRHIPRKVDLRTEDDIIFNQGDLGSCVANALASAFIFARRKQHSATAGPLEPFEPSRLFIYYNMRVVKDTVGEDSGAYIAAGLIGKEDGSGGGMQDLGACSEEEWKYDPWGSTVKVMVEDVDEDADEGVDEDAEEGAEEDEGTFVDQFVVEPPPGSRAAIKPPPDAYTNALQHKVIECMSINDDDPNRLDLLRACLDEGFPFMFGFSIFKKFVASDGREFEPESEEEHLGGHTVMAVGYDNATPQHFIIQNSWGEEWYDRGCFYMPFDFLLNYGYSFWTIREVSPNW